MTDRIDAKDLARAVQAGVLQPGQDQALLAFLRQHAVPFSWPMSPSTSAPC